MRLDILLFGEFFIGLAILLSVVIGIRALQGSRRLSNFQHRHRFLRTARHSFLIGGLLIVLLVVVILSGEVPFSPDLFTSPVPENTPTALPAITQTQSGPILVLPTSIILSLTLEPTGFTTPTLVHTATPAIPLPIQAQFQGIITPPADARISRLSFATEMKDNRLVGPSTRFRNPIRRMYVVYSYAHLLPGVQWTAIWYRDGNFLNYETRTWRTAETGAGITELVLGADEWLPGMYEVQMFVGSEWKASGTFTLSGVPPTLTPTSTITPTPTLTPTQSPSPTATSTRTRIPSPTPTP